MFRVSNILLPCIHRVLSASKSVVMSSSVSSCFSSESVNANNKLNLEWSPYLLQHASNPVNWFPWGDEAFTISREENKLIFLSVGYSTCHWCHVMEKECFENEEIAAIMNKHFVNIKVDREERPDVDKTYMLFIQLTRQVGGWPLSVFLNPDLKPIFGGTYFPPVDKAGMTGFKTILFKLAKQWEDDCTKLFEIGNNVAESMKSVVAFNIDTIRSLTKNTLPSSECIVECYESLSSSYNRRYGGFEIAPKFPQPSNINFLLHFSSWRHSGQTSEDESKRANALDMVLHTLTMMARGGIHDHVGQGFARYSTDEKWHVPHFEKMLYDQAQLAATFSIAYLVTKKSFFADVVKDILLYVTRDLSHKDGGFFSAEDADSFPTINDVEKREGAFYIWSYDEIVKHLSLPLSCNPDIQLSDIFICYYNIREGGNVDKHSDSHNELQNVLIVNEDDNAIADKFTISPSNLKFELKKACNLLLEVRNRRPRPHLDSKIITSWNGLMISGFAKACQALNDNAYKLRAIEAANFIKQNLWLEEKHLLHCCYTAKDNTIKQINKPIYGYLDDYAFLIRGLLDLYECCFNTEWLVWAEQLQDIQNEQFWDVKENAYNMTPSNQPHLIFCLKEDQDNVEPSGNSVAAHNLLKLSAFLERDDFEQKAEMLFATFSARLESHPTLLPELNCALMMSYNSVTRIYIIGHIDDPEVQNMLQVVNGDYIPNKILVVLDKENRSTILHEKSETVKNMLTNSNSTPLAYVCQKRTCSFPVKTATELLHLIQSQ